MKYLRAFYERSEDENVEGPIRFVASTEGVKRDGLNLSMDKWRLDNYARNPVVTWVHDFWGRYPPIGKADVFIDGPQLMADVTFDQEDEFARGIESKYRRGFLNAISVSWDDVEEEGGGIRHELLDIAAVPVPGDPDALIERQYRALKELIEEGEGEKSGSMAGSPEVSLALQRGGRAMPPHSTEKADIDEELEIDEPGDFNRYAWVDEEAGIYKLAHHDAEGKVVWRGVAAAMLRLLQAATQIPDADRRGVYNHLARHYKQFDKEAPEFRTRGEVEALGEVEIRGLFLEGEPEMLDAAAWLPHSKGEELDYMRAINNRLQMIEKE